MKQSQWTTVTESVVKLSIPFALAEIVHFYLLGDFWTGICRSFDLWTKNNWQKFCQQKYRLLSARSCLDTFSRKKGVLMVTIWLVFPNHVLSTSNLDLRLKKELLKTLLMTSDKLFRCTSTSLTTLLSLDIQTKDQHPHNMKQ